MIWIIIALIVVLIATYLWAGVTVSVIFFHEEPEFRFGVLFLALLVWPVIPFVSMFDN